MEQLNEERLRYIDTGKVKIGIYHQRKLEPDMNCDMEYVQQVMLPKPLAKLDGFRLPTFRECVRWLVS